MVSFNYRNKKYLLDLIFVTLIIMFGCSKEKDVKLATVNTLDASEVTGKTAVCGGDVVDDGGGTISERGICYSANGDPTISDSKVTTSGNTGKFTVQLTNLKTNWVITYRAYAINEAGVSYGYFKQLTTFPIPEVTLTIDNVSMDGFECTGNIVSIDIEEAGVCWGTNQNPTLAQPHEKEYTNPFHSYITGLTPGTTYHVRGFAKNIFGYGFSEDITITTPLNNLPEVVTQGIKNYTTSSITIEGEVMNECGEGTERGIIWGYDDNLSIENAAGDIKCGSGKGLFEGSINNIQTQVQYYTRAYAKNTAGIVYGDKIQFRYDIPVVNLESVYNIGGTKIKCIAEVTNTGGIELISEGYCWSTNPNPDINDNHTNSLEVFPTTLVENTVYYIRAFAQNHMGISYSSEFTFNSGYAFGTEMGGGMVFYNDGTGHGYICSTENYSGYIRGVWGCIGRQLGTSYSVGSSDLNTQIIHSNCLNNPNNLVVNEVYYLTSNGYSDWILPSIEALEAIYNNIVLESHAFFYNEYYWSSSELTRNIGDEDYGNYAWALRLNSPVWGGSDKTTFTKDEKLYGIPIRYF